MKDDKLIEILEEAYTHILNLALRSSEMQVILADLARLSEMQDGELLDLILQFRDMNRLIGRLKQNVKLMELGYEGKPPHDIYRLFKDINRIAP